MKIAVFCFGLNMLKSFDDGSFNMSGVLSDIQYTLGLIKLAHNFQLRFHESIEMYPIDSYSSFTHICQGSFIKYMGEIIIILILLER